MGPGVPPGSGISANTKNSVSSKASVFEKVSARKYDGSVRSPLCPAKTRPHTGAK